MDGSERGVGDVFLIIGEVGLAIDFSDAQGDADLIVLIGEQVGEGFEFGKFFVHADEERSVDFSGE